MELNIDLHPDVFNNRLFHCACQLTKDAVPNIRMTIAKCFTLMLTKPSIDAHRFDLAVAILREMKKDCDTDVRDVVFTCNLPPSEDELNNSTRNQGEHNNETFSEIASMSTASTVDLNCTEIGNFSRDNEESDESQDSISLYLDTDEKNSSK